MDLITQAHAALERLFTAGRLRCALHILQLLERASADQALQIEKFAANIVAP